MAGVKVFLFDLDGTLIDTGGAGLRALGRAAEQSFAIENVLNSINCAGKTDPAIFREIIFSNLNRPATPQDLDLFQKSYLRFLSLEVRHSKGYRILLGVLPFLDYLMTRGDILVGLATGNLETGAKLKLTRSQLTGYFPFGGFGSDSEKRSEILKIAHRKAQDRCRVSIKKESVFVIGDTPLDVKAAKEAGYCSVAVASGNYKIHELKEHMPDFLLEDMTEAFKFLKKADTVVPPITV